MAQKVSIELVDDLDGTEADETLTFGLDGKMYELDLNKKNATKLRKAMESYVSAGRKVTGTRRPTQVRSGPTGKEIREWARSAGLSVPDRGVVPNEIREAYNAAH